jgi:hypothetical protein
MSSTLDDLNPLLNQLGDMQERAALLRGYL